MTVLWVSLLGWFFFPLLLIILWPFIQFVLQWLFSALEFVDALWLESKRARDFRRRA